MRQIAIAGLAALVVLFGCSLVKPTAPSPAPATTAPATPQSPATAQGTGTTANSTAQPSGSVASQSASQPPPPPGQTVPPTKPKSSTKAAPQPATAAASTSSPSTAEGSSAAKPKAPVAKNAGNAPAAPVGAASDTVKPTVAAPGAGAATATTPPARQNPPPAPTLDLGSLEQRLKETRAIGVFSKLSLKNQVDDLLDQFRAFHKRQATLSLSQLRQRYDLLLLKVLSLLQDGDPPLAAAIASSREAIWGILTDPDKFAKI